MLNTNNKIIFTISYGNAGGSRTVSATKNKTVAMMNRSNLILTTSPPSQPAKNPDRTPSLTLRQRLLYGRKRNHHTVKERDSETGLYYYGARYLDSKTSRWLSGDPAMGDYVPEAPVSDEARKRNGNLPGMGGVFNFVNLHVYHYAGNNPIKYVDPNGREDAEDFKILLSETFDTVGNIFDLVGKQDINRDDIIQLQDNLSEMGEAIKEAPSTFTTLLMTSFFLGIIALDNKDAIAEGNDFLKSHGVNVMEQTITFEDTIFRAKLTIGGVTSLETNIKFDSRNSLQVILGIGFEGSENGLRVNGSMDVTFTIKIGR